MAQETRNQKAELELLKEIDNLRLELKQLSAASAVQAQNLIRERNLLRTLIDTLPDYVYFKDAQSRFIDANKATLRIMKCESIQDLVGKTDFEFYPREFAEKYYADECQILRTGEPKLNLEEKIINESGQLRVLSTRKVALKDGSGQIVGLVGIGRDITEYKHAEEVKFEKDKRLAEIGALATTVAHELRNPLAVIQAATYNLKKNPHLSNSQQLTNIEKKLWESGMIIENLLSYSRIKPPLYEAIDLPDVLNECVSFLHVRFKDYAMAIEKDYDPQVKKIDADPLQIREIFTNILNNAGQALPDKKGTIRLMLRRQADMVKIVFKDTGVGIDDADMDKIFTPFFSLKPKGTGLGLAICNELVQRHYGRIEVESHKGEGSTFTVILPIKKLESCPL